MARKLALLLTLVDLSVALSSPAQAPTPAPDCSNVLLTLAGCADYVSAGSTKPKPGTECCDGLKSVLNTTGVNYCLCDAFKNAGTEYGVQLNMTKSLDLPAACHVNFSIKQSCHFGPATAPVPAHSPPATSPSPSVQGTPSASVPGAPSSSTGSSESSGSSSSSLPISVALLILNLIVAVFLT